MNFKILYFMALLSFVSVNAEDNLADREQHRSGGERQYQQRPQQQQMNRGTQYHSNQQHQDWNRNEQQNWNRDHWDENRNPYGGGSVIVNPGQVVNPVVSPDNTVVVPAPVNQYDPNAYSNEAGQ